MGFALPTALALLVLALPILLLYLLRLRRQERDVSSTYLWDVVVRDLEANAPWQRLRRNLLLILQLAALASIVLALAAPFLPSDRLRGQDLIVVVDTSASMAATDLYPSRLEVARRETLRLANRLPSEGRVTLIAAGPPPRVLLAHSADRGLLRRSLQRLQAAGAASDLTPALQLAATLAAESTQVEVVLLSDGRVSVDPDLELPSAFRFVPLGDSGDNQGLVACSLRAVDGRQALFVRLRNYAAEAVERRLDLYVDGALVTARHLDLPGRGEVGLSFELSPTVEAVEVRLEGTAAGIDALPLDDVAWVVPSSAGRGGVVLVADGNRFLQTGLGLMPEAEVEVVSPADFGSWWAGAQEENRLPALIVFDAYVPQVIPSTNLLFVAPPQSTALFEIEGAVEAPRIQPLREDDPLLRFVDIEGVQVRRAQAVSLPPWARAVLEDAASGWPLLLAGEVDGRRVAVLSFDLHDSDLPLQVAFPLLLNNLYAYLVPTSPSGLPTALRLGEPLLFAPPPSVEEIVFRAPNGQEETIRSPSDQVLYDQTALPGLYHVRWRGEGGGWFQSAVAVSLLSAEEGEISPRQDLSLPTSAAGARDDRERAGRLSLRPFLVVLGLLLLLAEWGVAHRGAWTALLPGPSAARRRDSNDRRGVDRWL